MHSMSNQSPGNITFIQPDVHSPDGKQACSELRGVYTGSVGSTRAIQSQKLRIVALAEDGIILPYRDIPIRRLQAVGLIGVHDKDSTKLDLVLPNIFPVAVIDKLVVPLPERRKGYATELMGHIAVTAAAEWNCQALMGIPESRVASAFLSKMGFQPHPTEPESPYLVRSLNS